MLKVMEWRVRFLKLNIIIFVGGRVHQQDNHAQDIVYDLLDFLEKDKAVAARIVFIDNYNIWEAPLLFQGADASIMLADDTREASATGFMKAQMNGASVIATSDGAIPEFVRFSSDGNNSANGFSIPYLHGEPTPQNLLEALEAFDGAYRDPKRQAAMMRAALLVTPQVDSDRTAQEMKQLYEQVLTKTEIEAR
jgi:glucan phosphorylase